MTRRLSQENFTHADKATVINAVRTYAELKHFMAARDREMPPEELDLRPFLDTGTEGPVMAFNSLRWISRQKQLNWLLEESSQRQQQVPENNAGHKQSW